MLHVIQVIMKEAVVPNFSGMLIWIGVGWTILVASEMVAASCGLGYMVLRASQFLASNIVIMGISDRPLRLHFRSPNALPETRSGARKASSKLDGWVIQILFLI